VGWRLLHLGIFILAAAFASADGRQEGAPCAATESPSVPVELPAPSLPADHDQPSVFPSAPDPFCACIRERSSLRAELRQPGLIVLRSPESSAQLGIVPAWRSGHPLAALPPHPRLHVLLCTWLI
jgi:hypothetical protein